MCPFYLSLGMTYDLYWEGNPIAAKHFYQAQIHRNNQRNAEMYLQGCYVFDAISTALSNVHLDGKYHAPNKYLKEPYRLKGSKEEEAEIARKKIIDGLNAWKASWDKKKQSQK